ncbi:MAG: cofactor-independent phosphoglycerate mutase [Deltaproteobacteria bacterium]|nr:cofactor-independent phosphoglycerate mutase [Deltaproteobacteria bacterium]
MKYLILIGDGMGDYPCPELNGLTPLEAAQTPVMDHIASCGELGLAQTIPEGMPPGSDVANLNILGYDPRVYHTGRAPLEAASLGLQLKPGQIAFRLNLVTLATDDQGRTIMGDYSAGHITTPESGLIIDQLKTDLAGPGLSFHTGVSYRHLLIIDGGDAQADTIPPHDIPGQQIAPYLDRLGPEALIVKLMNRAQEILPRYDVNKARIAAGKKPANGIWLWGQGPAPAMPTIKEKYGLDGAIISAVDLLKGIGRLAGLKVIDVPGATGYLDTNYQGKADAALESLREGDFVFVHVEAPDEAGHTGLLHDKLKAIEDFDAKIVSPILEGLRTAGHDFRLLIMCDHLTPLQVRTHTREPVPFALMSSSEDTRQAAGTRPFTEKAAQAAGLLVPHGRQLINRLVNAERAK